MPDTPTKDTTKNKTAPLTAEQLLGTDPGDPVSLNIFKSALKQTDTEATNPSSMRHYTFNPHSPELEYIPNATPNSSNIDYFNSLRQSNWSKAGRAAKQFGANIVSSVGQGLANTFDLVSLGNTLKGEITGGEDQFQSSLFGLTTKEMQEWANGVEERNRIFEAKPGSFDMGDFGWWSKQFASAGTGVGMAIEAVGTTVAIEAATGGTGAAAALAKLGNLFSKARGAGYLKEGLDIAKGLKSAATLYGTISRYSESRMEAQQNYDQIYQDLASTKNPDGTQKFTEEEKKYIASEGARRTFNLNMLLLPLDIIGYRTMVYNPISGTSKGLIEKTLGKIGNKWIRRGVQGTVFSGLEGTEEGLQFVAQDEGQHYAKVLGGTDDASSFLQRLGKDVKSDEFWNNFAGGVIGSPIIGGVMKLGNKMMGSNSANRLNSVHEDYVKNVAKMDNAIAERIKELDSEGRDSEANILRRQFGANKAVSALHLDALTDKSTAFDSYVNFLNNTVDELNENNTDVLKDLGYNANLTPEQLEVVKEGFTKNLSDAMELQSIYSEVAGKYNKNFVPQITQAHFQLNRLSEIKSQVANDIVKLQAELPQFGQLSSFGREQYNAEYDINALKQEQSRLTDLYRDTSNQQEKQNIEQLIESNKIRLSEINSRLKEIEKDESYTPSERNSDNDILKSALRNRAYSGAIRQREYTDNTIALQRKNISLWNNSEYLAEKTKESVSKAKTRTQVENTEEELIKNNQATPEVQQAIQDKKNQIAAEEAARVVISQREEQENSVEVPGNSNLFEDENNLIDTIKEQQYNTLEQLFDEPVPDFTIDPKTERYLFTPSTYNFDKSSDEAKAKVINGVRGLLNKLGNQSSFEDLVRHVIKVQGATTAEEIFNALKYGWQKNNMPEIDYEAVYDKIFGNSMDELLGGVRGLSISTETQLEKATDVTTTQVIVKENNQQSFDNANQPRYEYKGVVTNESSPKMAFVSRISDIVQQSTEEGISVSHEYTSDELNQGDYVDSLPLLDPDRFDEGTPMVIKVPGNYNEIKIPVYNPDGTKGKAMSFGQYIAQNNIKPGSQEYLDKLPMIIYRKGAPTTEKGVAFVHDIGWYHPLRFNQDKKGDMEKAIQATRDIRAEVIANGLDKITDIIITGKRQTTFSGLKTRPDQTISLREANPETQLTVALTTDSLSTSKKNTVFPNNNTTLVNNSPFKVGQILDVRRYGKKDGKNTYIALPVLRPKLDEVSRSSVVRAIEIYANRANPNSPNKEKYAAVVNQIKTTMGLDILSPQGLEKYLQHFISTFNTEKARTNEDVEAQARAKYGAEGKGTPYIAFIAGGNIVFGRTDEAAYVNNAGAKKYSYFINPNISAPSNVALANLVKPNILGWYEQNIDLENLNKNKPVVTIATDYSTKTSANSYNDFLLDRLKTNIRSYNIGTTEKPNYVTNIQPIITYELQKKLQQEAKTNEEVRQEINEDTGRDTKGVQIQTGINPIGESKLSDLERQIIEQAKKDLGSDFGISQDTVQFFPSTSKFGIGISLYKAAIEKTAFSIEQGVKLDEAIRRGVEYIKSNYGDSLSEKEYIQHLKDAAGISLLTKEQFTNRLNEIDKAYIGSRYRRSRFVDFIGLVNSSELSEQDIREAIKKSSIGYRDKNILTESILGREKAVANKIRHLREDYNLSPSVLTETQRANISSSINRIAGLTPDQQFDITDFMYNQITAMVNLDNRVVSRKEVDAQVKKAFDEVIQPLKENYTSKIAELNKTVTEHPSLKPTIDKVIKDYQYRIDKIKAIEDNFAILKDEAYNKVAKYTGITENKVQNEKQNDEQPSEENPDISAEEEKNDRERDFWTDILQENPESKLSYSMRRFFGQTREYDKSGNPVTGFLGLPKYVGADTVIRTLMVTLADVPSDFNLMINKLESRVDGVHWMREVIDRLKGASQQKKNQFVTVMSNTSLRMKFTMISFNRKTNSWSTKVFETNQSGIANAVKEEWKGNFFDSSLATATEEGSYKLNKDKANQLIQRFESWKGQSLVEVPIDMSMYRPIVDQVKLNKPATFIGSGDLNTWLLWNLSKGNKARFSLKGYDYQITNIGDNRYEMAFLNQASATREEVENWLKDFGIVLTDGALDELLSKGLFHNYQQRRPNDLFTTDNGLFQILYNKLKILVNKDEHDFTEYGDNPLDESVITSLANLESKYNDTQTPFGFRDNGKSLFALTAPKFINDRVRDLKSTDSVVKNQLLATSFSSPSLWLRLLSDGKFREKFQVSHMGLNAFKELGKRLYRDNGITKLSDLDHELTKLGMFWDMTQGEVNYGEKNLKTYPDTDVEMRMATMFSPTMSDKSLMTVVTTAVLNLQNKDLNDGKGITDEVAKILYEQLAKPELQRMIKFYQNGGVTNISGYDKGAGMFLFLPELNNIEYTQGLRLIDAIKHKPNDFTLQFIEGNSDLMTAFRENLKGYVSSLVEQKVKVWTDNGMVISNDNKTDLKFFDKKYLDKFRGENNIKVQMAAMDFVINNLVSNSNSFMVIAGDPAIYYKSKGGNYTQQAKDTFINAGKRLANQIAPGTTISNSENEKYIQLFLEDRKNNLPDRNFLKFVTKVNDGNEITDNEIDKLVSGSPSEKAAIVKKYPVSAGYFSIESSDGQEYTTWKEHLDVLARMGKTPDNLLDITPEEIEEARELFSSGISKNKLTEKQQQLIGKVLQPIKPVYTGQVFDATQDVMRTVYIKSSSFPLIPQLTTGMEIDKLRVAMEKLENSSKMNVRASYQTANKAGALTNSVQLWNQDGTANIESLKDIANSSLILDRKNFRIQQEVPFKSAKKGDDRITLGTQLMKLLFGDEIMAYDGFVYNGEVLTGARLHSIYNNLFIGLVQEKRNQLFDELGLDSNAVPIDPVASMSKLQTILKDEAVKRGYPLQDIQGLTLNDKGEFNLPLWASSNSNRYESMLNSIVTNRIIRLKFPGNSFVVGSEEGFQATKILEEGEHGIDKSKIIFTSAWNGSSLTATSYDNGKIKKAQVLVPSKFKNADGELIDLFLKENNEYKYITKTDQGFRLKEDMFDKDLLSMISFRLPTSGLQSSSQIEIVGFVPYENGDLMIVPKSFTKQKGLDYDIDKENAYNYWTHFTKDGKYEVLQEKHRSEILASADREMSKITAGSTAYDKLILEIFGPDVKYTPEDIAGDKFLTKLNSKITEKLIQNELIRINHSVYNNPDPKVQSKINRTLNTDFAEQQAEFIESLSENTGNDYWTPLSDEYQKQKLIMGSSGKIGTGAYSLDVVFHSLAQQARLSGKPIELVEAVEEGDNIVIRPKTWRFGTIESVGILGGTVTLDGGRSISEVHSERQNINVDNEKLQVIGRVGLNDMTMDVDKLMNMVGFDKGKDGNSISFLFLSQPIIKEYIHRMKNANSNMAEFEPNKEDKIVNELLKKYDADTQDDMTDDYQERMSSLMTNENFITAIKSTNPDGKLQGGVLRRFIEMKKYGVALRGIQVAINTDSKGLGKSFFDVIEKRNALNRLGLDTKMIVGASNLIGNYQSKDDIDEETENQLLSQGYYDIGEYLVKPETLSGGFNIMGVSTAYNLWRNFFPYDAPVTNKAFSEVLAITGSESMGDAALIERKQDIFRGMKKYFSASKLNGIISPDDDINAERARLYIDSETNTSLAKYLKSLKQLTGNPVVDQFIKSNKLLNRFEYDIQKNGQPSLIKYNNAAGEEFDEQYLYESLSTLMEVRGRDGKIALPKIGNKEYTLDTLAQDIIAYAYLGNAIQEAIQFTKYVPVSYLNTVGFSEKMRVANSWLRDNPNILGIKLGDKETQKHLISEFTMQYVQHNPEKVNYKLDNSSFSKQTIKIDDNSFQLKGEDKPIFISVYDNTIPKGEKKFRLYWFDGEKYSRIPILGAFGMDEYQPRNNIGTSLVNGKSKLKIDPQPATQQEVTNQPIELYKINTGTAHQVMESIANSNSEMAPLAKSLLPYINDVKLVVADQFEYGRGNIRTQFDGVYHRDINTIIINSSITNDEKKLSSTFIHEIIHALTVNQIQPYITIDPSGVSVSGEKVPSHVSTIVSLFNNLKAKIKKEDLDYIRKQLQNDQSIEQELIDRVYPFFDIYEFIAMALGNKEFQKILAGIEYRNSGKSLLEKFKAIIKEVLTSLGVNFNENSAAAHALDSIFQFIEETNTKTDTNPYQTFYDESMNYDNLDDLIDGTDPEAILNPSTKQSVSDYIKSLSPLQVKCD